ncbi:MAG: thioredoxin domain-containing protein [Raoultibacter sp.]
MRKLVYFHVSYCGPCRSMLEKTIKPLKAEYPERVEIVDAMCAGEKLNEYSVGDKMPLTIVTNDEGECWRHEGVCDALQLIDILNGA